MKKNKGFILNLISFGIIVPYIANYLTFKSLSHKLKSKYSEFYYPSAYGKIRYIKKGKGMPLLLIHGIGAGSNLDEWYNSIDTLSKSYTVYAIDLLGFGNSEKPGISYSAYLYAGIINEFIENIIKKPSYVIAASNSAAFALTAYKLKPENIEKLMLISPTGPETQSASHNQIKKLMGRLLETPHFGTTLYNLMTSRAMTAYFLKKYCYYNPLLVNSNMVNKYHLSAHTGGVSCKYPIAALLTGHFDLPIKRHLEDIKIPVHIIWGAENSLNPAWNINKFDGIKEDIYISVIENTKLLPHNERPKTFCALCKEFFE